MDKEKSMKKQEINNPYIQCPFCKEEDFDLIGLKAHIERGCCDVFNSTLTIEEEEEAVKRITDKINASEQAIEILTEGLANAEVDLMKIKYNLEWLDKARDYVVNRVGIENNFKVFLLSILNYSNIDCWMENITDKDLSIEQSVKEAIETNIEDACR